ncbi:hypothetical protein GMSM_20720 [Geomonas sp. Red276]
MFPYLFTLAVVVCLGYLATRKGVLPHESKVYLSVAFAAMVLLGGLRDQRIGTDSPLYVRLWDVIHTMTDVVRVSLVGGDEYGIWVLSWLLKKFSDQYMILFFAVALIVVGCYFKSIVTHTTNLTISLFIFITTGFYTFFFNGERQGLSCAICSLALKPAMERNFKKYLAIVLLALCFHKTAIIMLPVYLVLGKTNTLKTNLLYLAVGVVGVVGLQKAVELSSKVDERYSGYAAGAEGASGGGGYLISAFNCGLTLFFFLMKDRITVDRRRYEFFLNMLSLGAVISMVSAVTGTDPSGLLRFTLYFNLGAVFLWPILYENVDSSWSKVVASYLVMVCYIVFFTMTTQRFSDLAPYRFNPLLTLF